MLSSVGMAEMWGTCMPKQISLLPCWTTLAESLASIAFDLAQLSWDV
jgi:hypothetical protein